MKAVTVRLSAQDAEALRAFAQARGLTYSDAMRRALHEMAFPPVMDPNNATFWVDCSPKRQYRKRKNLALLTNSATDPT